MNFILQITKLIPSCHKSHSNKWTEPSFCEPLRISEKHSLRVRMALWVRACKIHPQQQNNFFPSQWSPLCTPPTVLNHQTQTSISTGDADIPRYLNLIHSLKGTNCSPSVSCHDQCLVFKFARTKHTFLTLRGNPAAGQSLCTQSSNGGSGAKS